MAVPGESVTHVRRWLATRLASPRESALQAIRAGWSCLLVSAGVLLVVVPVGYATDATHVQVARAAGYGFVAAIGIALRTHRPGRAWLGLLIGAVVGLVTVRILGILPPNIQGALNTLPSAMALTLGMIAGFGEGQVDGYPEAIRESSFVTLMFMGLTLIPVSNVLFIMPLMLLPSTAAIAGFFARSPDGRPYALPPTWLTLLVLSVLLLLSLLVALEGTSIAIAAPVTVLALIPVPAMAFLTARAVAVWLHPRLLFYNQLAAYLRVMWIPIGSLAIGYLIIIVVFAGFYGTLERFSPGSFENVGGKTGIMIWLSFAFFTGVGGDYTGVVPVSPGARALVGAQLIPTVAWVLVMFAAVMAYLRPKLDRIAERDQP